MLCQPVYFHSSANLVAARSMSFDDPLEPQRFSDLFYYLPVDHNQCKYGSCHTNHSRLNTEAHIIPILRVPRLLKVYHIELTNDSCKIQEIVDLT